MPSVTGTGAIGVSYRAIVGVGVANDTVANAQGFGVPALSGAGVVASFHGAGALTTSAASLQASGAQTFTGTGGVTTASASLSGTGAQTCTGTGALATAAASLEGAGAQTVSGTGDLTTAPAALLGSAAETYLGTGALESAAASVDGAGEVLESITGTGALVTAAASVSGAGTSAAETPTGGYLPPAFFGAPRRTRLVEARAALTPATPGVRASVAVELLPPPLPPAPCVASGLLSPVAPTLPGFVWVDPLAQARVEDDEVTSLLLMLAHR